MGTPPTNPMDFIPLSDFPGFDVTMIPENFLGPATVEMIWINVAIGATEWYLGRRNLPDAILLSSVTVIPAASTSLSAYMRVGLNTIVPAAAADLAGSTEIGLWSQFENVGDDRIHFASAGGSFTIPMRRRVDARGRRWCLQMTGGTAVANGGVALCWYDLPTRLPRWILRYLRILD